jgi:hypothetical protein
VTSLARCVGDDDRFLAEHWGRAPLHLPGIDPGGFGDLLSPDDVDQLISSSFLRLPAVRLVRDGTPLDPATYTRSARLGNKDLADVADPGRVYERFREGATIVLQGLQRFWSPLTRFCRELELELTHAVQVNAYITPPAAQALAVHYDTHDVFVLQFGGSKQWSIHEPVLEDPLASQPWSSRRGRAGDPILAASLATGDSLYVPRGFLHSALAQEGISAHLTIGVVTTTWADVLRTAIAGIDDEVDFRRALPVGFAHEPDLLAPAVAAHLEQLRAWLEKVDIEAVAQRTARRFWSGRTPLLAGQLHQLSLLDDIHDRSRVRRRPGTICRIHVDVDTHADRVHVLLGDRELHMPAPLEPVVRRLADATNGMAVGALADELDQSSRLVLVRRLVREGLLEVVDVG